MMILAGILAAAAGATLVTSGYLFGAQKGKVARDALASKAAEQEGRASSLGTELAAKAAELAAKQNELTVKSTELAKEREKERAAGGAHLKQELKSELQGVLQQISTVAQSAQNGGGVQELRAELRSLGEALRESERAQEKMKLEMREQLESVMKSSQKGGDVELQKTLQRMMAPLLQKEDDTKRLREMMREVLSPMLDRERLGRDLAQIDGGKGLVELPRLLDSIAEKGGFSALVLSDEVGLPLAASQNARDVDTVAGMSSLLLTLADRAASNGSARPTSFVVHDETNQMTLHRIFHVGEARFILTAVSRGVYVAPNALDPALTKLERALTKEQVWS